MYTTKELPLNIMLMYSKMNGDEKQLNKVEKLKDFHCKMMDSYMAFNHFTNNQWQYDSVYSDQVMELMSEEEKQIFNIDVSIIDWYEAETYFLYGIKRFFLKEDMLAPER